MNEITIMSTVHGTVLYGRMEIITCLWRDKSQSDEERIRWRHVWRREMIDRVTAPEVYAQGCVGLVFHVRCVCTTVEELTRIDTKQMAS